MARPALDPRIWNLSVPITAFSVVGCGPQVFLEDGTGDTVGGATDTDGDTDTSPGTISATDPTTPTTTAPPPECTGPGDCPPGSTCDNGMCVSDDSYCYYGDYGGYGEGGCCQDGGCCYGDGCYYGCYSDFECGPGAICDNDYGYGNCESFLALDLCPEFPELVPLPVPAISDVASLSFVEVDGDGRQDLVIGHGLSADLLRGPADAPPVPLPLMPSGAVTGAASGDYDGDMIPDLAISDEGGTLTTLAGDGMAGFTLASSTGGVGSIADLWSLRWDEDDVLDLAGLNAQGVPLVLLGDGMGGVQETVGLQGIIDPGSMATGDFDGDGRGDIVVQDLAGEAWVWFASSNVSFPDINLPGHAHGERRVATTALAGGAASDVVAYTAIDGWVLLEAWLDGASGPTRVALFGLDQPAAFAVGDVDGNGSGDVVLAQGTTLWVVLGSTTGTLFSCAQPVELGDTTPVDLAVGDLDGDGRAEIAMRDASGNLSVLSPM